MGGAACIGDAAPGEGAAEADRLGRVPQHQFSYSMGLDGVEQFVATPELQSEDSIGGDPLPAGQVWAISPGGQDEAAGLYRIEVTEGPGSGVRILNQSPPGAVPRKRADRRAESLCAGPRTRRRPQSARARVRVQLRSFDSGKSGANLGVAVLIALCSALLGRPLKGGLAVVGGLNLGGSIERSTIRSTSWNWPWRRAPATVLMPVSSRRALVDLSDEVAARVQVAILPRCC